MELWDVYDGCFRMTGRTHERGMPLPHGDYHLVVHIYPVNKKGEILIQKRVDTVSWKPGYWAATGGSATAGEDAFTACQRELKEEIGLEATLENSSLALMYRRNDSFSTVWLVRTDADLEEFQLQPEEVAAVKWVSPEEIKKMITSGIFIDYSYLDYLFTLIKLEFGT